MDKKLFVSSSPHVHGQVSTPAIMWTVVLSLLPATLWSFYLFGLPAVTVVLGTVALTAALEAISNKVAGGPLALRDGSAVLTGLLLALTLPPGLPLWMCGAGAFVSVVVAKAFFGGLGQNLFNPAMTGRVFLLIAFPAAMTKWLVPRGTGESLLGHPVTAYDTAGKLVELTSAKVDAITAATPLGLLCEKGAGAVAAIQNSPDLFIGQLNGSLGETSAAFLLLGGLFLLVRRIITWHIPVAYIGTVAVIAAITHAVDPAQYASVAFHVFTGGLMIGAFFMATDYVTSPMYPMGKLIFGVGCGVLTMVIRLWGGYPEGVSFAVLLLNACVPIIDNATRPKKFGLTKLAAA
ncbi:MAG: RnfABCDGE type electron transport complex subunit D [Myxococcota bacterium]|jgi:electron transport complex protein RnfD|nr:RnfABCDGE type electron transport complex subunit D [Myxococcota bacterium]